MSEVASGQPTPLAPPAPPTPVAKVPPRRRRLLLLLLVVMLVAGVCFGAYEYFIGSNHVGTDDAYVNGNLVRLTPQVSGTVVSHKR